MKKEELYRWVRQKLLFLLYRKDRLWRSLELKNARTEAGTTTRRSLD